MATALYRRYRPESFADVIGQEHVTEPLMQALRTGRVNHAYLFSGPRGCGKTTSARILARCLNCEEGPTPTPCGVCASCVALARGGAGSVDVIEIDAASHGGVDDARDLRERASYGPAQSRFKIYIIDEAHMVTPQGFNALLKIVEEPPEHVKFVFATTEPEKVIGTIRSRTHHYPFRLVPPAKLTAYMEHLLQQEGVAVQPGVLSFVTRAGGGSVRDSLSVLDQLIAGSGADGLTYEGAVSLLGFTDGELLDATVDALAAGDGAATFRQIDRVIESGHDPRRFVEDLLERLRDLIVVAAVQEGAGQVLRGLPDDQLERMRVQQAAFGPGALSRAADIVNTGLTEMTGATAPRMQLELICARILLPSSSGEQGYGARLDRLERRLEVGGVPTGARASAATQPVHGQQPQGQPAQGQPVPAPQAVAPVAAPARTVSDYTPPASAVSSGARPPGGPAPVHGPGDAGRVDAARAEAGAPPVVAPRESVGGPSATDPEHQGAGAHEEAPEAAAAHASDHRSDHEADHASAPSAPHEVVHDGSRGVLHAHGGGETEAGSGGSPDASPGGAQDTGSGGMDTAAIRRAWPNVLGRIFTMRRITWTFVSQNAQVTAFDGRTLTLGIATAGLTTTFRAGNHAEVVRQALIDELGVDAVVDGVHVEEVSQQAPVAPPAGAVQVDDRDTAPIASAPQPPGPTGGTGGDAGPSGGSPTRPSWGDAGAGHAPSVAGGSPGGPGPSGSGRSAPPQPTSATRPDASGGSRTALADAGLSAAPAAGRSSEQDAGWGSPSGPAPDWATAPSTTPDAGPSTGPSTAASAPTAPPAPPAGSPAPVSPGTGAPATAPSRPSGVSGARAARAALSEARSAHARRTVDDERPARPLTDDSAVSVDDEDIEVSADTGRAVIERVLGGRVVQEIED